MIMKKIKKLLALGLALIMCLGMTVTALADDDTPPTSPPPTEEKSQTPDYTITISNNKNTSGVSIVGKTYSAYKIFEASYDNADHVAYTYNANTCLRVTYPVGEGKSIL